jgi:hypothetical protein
VDAGQLFDRRKHARHLVYADGFKIECPTGSRIMLTLSVVADDARRTSWQTGQLPLHA